MRRRSDPYEDKEGAAGVLVWLFRLIVLAVAVTACFVAVLMLYSDWQSARLGGAIRVEGGNPDLNPFERIYLQGFLASRAEELSRPVGEGVESIVFVVAPGENANQIADNLVAAGFLQDAELFRNYLRYYGLDSRLEAGNYQLSPQLNIPDLATALTRAYAQDVVVRFLEGWRIGEMSDYLAATRPANIEPEEFKAITERTAAFDISKYDFLASLPAGASLEGFLFPDTYRIPVDADASYLVDLMLENFGQRVTPALRQSFGLQGLTVHEAVTLASIVQREAVVADERPVMVGVFLNRLDLGMPLAADPTVQYAVGYQPDTGEWWKSELSRADLELSSPYNTYRNVGLPPGPIASPGLAALEAVARPIDSEYLFFVTDCVAETPGSHVFSMTFEEHLTNVELCR